MTGEVSPLARLRDEIDRIDGELIRLISERARCAEQVAQVKLQASGGESVVFYRPEREAQVLRRVMERNPGPLPNEELARLFREIMSACLALEHPMRVVFLGPEGTFTHAAALKHFGHSVVAAPLAAMDEVFREVQAGAAPYGVVPIEDSTEGVISHTLDLFMNTSLKICGEVQQRIHHHLLVSPQANPEQKITRIVAHQQSFLQCRQWLDAHYAGVERVVVASNADAARLVQDDSGSAAIAGEMAAEIHRLVKLAANIEDRPDNITRFLIIGREKVGVSGADRTSIMVSMKNEAGALYRLLEPFHRHHISLTRIETRPYPGTTWAQVFFIDFEGHVDDVAVCRALDDVSRASMELKHLGSYPVGVL